MAHQSLSLHWKLPAIIAVTASLVVAALSPVLTPLEDGLLPLRYSLRGDRAADSNIVIVYVDDEAVQTLGWPVRRNFYALMISVLTELDVAAIGLEPVLEEPRPEYAEYDELIATVTRGSSRVVVTSYVESWDPSPRETPGDSSAGGLVLRASPRVFEGTGFHGPFPPLEAAAAGLGHLNISERWETPVLVRVGGRLLPAFGAELLRVGTGGRLWIDGAEVATRGEPRPVAFSTDGGAVRLNFPGPAASFVRYPFLEVLKSYDALRSGRQATLDIGRLREKLVLIGIAAEGRGQLVSTPVDGRLPAVFLHATFLENALRGAFLRSVPFWAAMVITVLLTFLASLVGIGVRFPWNVAAVLATLLVFVAAAILLFALADVAVPVVPPLLAAAAAAAAAGVLGYTRTRTVLHHVTQEKDRLFEQLRDREARVATLERELAGIDASGSGRRVEELQEQIRRYRVEIKSLSARADDMEPFVAAQEERGRASVDFEGIVYADGGPVADVVSFVRKIAATNAPVLVLGESGTGKELVARAIHKHSDRSGGPFVAVNCGALAETLLETELFGHEKGAFTGAVKDRMGRFELAHRGTIFLDEIGETGEAFQVKLLRVLQEGELERVGGVQTLKVDVRVIAATNNDIKDLVQQRRFREDLFYRLNVFAIDLPPLRERPYDLPVLVDHFLRREGGDLSVSRNAYQAILAYAWPGNVRELESAVKRAALLARAEKRTMIGASDLPEDVASMVQGREPLEDQILQALRERGFSRSAVTGTAGELGGLNRGTVAEYLRGECIKAFCNHRFDLGRAARSVSQSPEQAVNDRVEKRLAEYLANLVETVDKTRPWEESLAGLRPKLKNLPLRYHRYCEEAAEAYFRGLWKVPPGEGVRRSD